MRTLVHTGIVRVTGRAQGSPAPSSAGVVALRRGSWLPWRVLVALGLLCAALATAAYEILPGMHPSSAVAVRHHPFSREGLLSLPLSARGPVSGILGEKSAAYAIHPDAQGFSAADAPQHLSSKFTASGVSVSSGATHFGLRLLGYGSGSALRSVGPVAPRRTASNRIDYDHPGVEEWYANGPLGLEQGFTVARTPAAHVRAPLTLAIRLSGNPHASLARGGQSISLSRAGGAVLRYTGLTASDARGRTLHGWLSLAGGRILLNVDVAGASYPLHIDPLVQEQELTAGSKGELGASVAVSADGSTALVGAPQEKEAYGAAYVFKRTGATWAQKAEFNGIGEETEAGDFGASVALSANGGTAVVGAPRDKFGVGAVWVFTRNAPGEDWSQQGPKLTGGEEGSDAEFGERVALSSEGNTALVGGPNEEVNKTITDGAAWVFTRASEKWTQQGPKLVATGECCEGGEGGEFGWSLALSAEGNSALIAAPFEGPAEPGGVYAFSEAKGKWTQEGTRITPSGEEGEGQFGESLALSAEGNTALIGAPDEDEPHGFGPGAGGAWVFTLSGKKWKQQGGRLLGSGAVGDEDQFGESLALSANGDVALIGARQDNTNVGAAWTFTRSGETWTQQGEKLTGAEEVGNGWFGASVALSADGRTALIGGPHANSISGGAWVFVSGATVSAETASEVTTTTAKLSASVNPNGEEVTSCKFEYGTTVSYGKTAACSPSPGAGESPVAVSASPAPEGLSVNATYHFRVSAANAFGTSHGADATFTTLATVKSAEAKKETETAEAKDGQLTATASSGTGTVTVGPYGADIGGPGLWKSTGKYFDVYHASGSTFKVIEVKDCELGGGKALWWYHPGGTWESISEPTAVYHEGSPACITATFTENTHPSVAELIGTRYGTRYGEPPGSLEYGKCVATKHGYYKEGNCVEPDVKEGVAKGKYAWYPYPDSCYPMKKGYYANSECTERDEKKGKPKGKFESGGKPAFEARGGSAKFEIGAGTSEPVGTLECGSSTTTGSIVSGKTGLDVIIFQGCSLGQHECQSGSLSGTIQTSPLESFIEDEVEGEVEKVDTEVYQDPIMSFTCGTGEQYILSGGFRGETTQAINTMSAESTTVYSPTVAEQELVTTVGGKGHKTTMTTSYTTSLAGQEIEIKTNPGSG